VYYVKVLIHSLFDVRYELVNGYIKEGMGAIQALQLAAKHSSTRHGAAE
jgi:hypothetical protein